MLVKAKHLLIQVTRAPLRIVTQFVVGDKPFYRHFWFWTVIVLGGGILAVNHEIRAIDSSLPNKSELQAIAREQTLTIKAADGTILQQQGEATTEQLKLIQIPDKLKKAFIASEDRRFAQHNGVDFQGVSRAFFDNLRSRGVVEGGSTITQQVARILFLTQEKTIWRKLKEIRLAQKLERELSKDQILERYLNLVYLGSGAYGVADAAWIYFGKPVDKLTLSETATLAGLAPAPNTYAPDKNPQAARMRRNLVLQRMQEDGVITAAERAAAVNEPLIVHPNLPKRLQIKFPYFTSYVQKELPKYVSADVLASGGLVVETTLNPTWQSYAESAVAKVLKNQGRWQNFQEAALVTINPQNGEIQAMVGGKDFGKNQFNRVTQAKRQPGSTFKGFVYAAAIASGKNPDDTYEDEPIVIDGYTPKNSSKRFVGTVSLQEAIAHSINSVAVKVLIDVGFEPVIKLAHDMGIKSDLKPTYSLALGSSEVNLLELTSAYGSFATQGLHTEVHGIRRIINRQGKVIWSANYPSKQVLDTQSSAIITSMLQNVVEAGTGASAQLDNRPVAGKTGTTDEARDLWFIGYIPQLVTGVWLGNDDNHPTDGTSDTAAVVWHEFMAKVVLGMPVEKFPPIPPLEGRKPSIVRQPVKAKKILTESNTEDKTANVEKSEPDNSDNSDSETRHRSRHRHRHQRDDEDKTTNVEKSEPDNSDNSDSETRHRSRHRHRHQRDYAQVDEQQSNYTPRHRRRHHQEQTEDSTPTKKSLDNNDEPQINQLHHNSEVSAHRRHHHTKENSSEPATNNNNNSSSGSSSESSSGSSSPKEISSPKSE
jgi:penicillin-binding protein 1A